MDIRLLVLFSLTLRVFLFFAGRFQMCFNDKILRIIIWAVYVGADAISAYALTSLSGQDYIPWSLAFFWAPFLLNHLGGQDTITAFSMEDNNLWLRQLYYLVFYAFLVGLILRNSFGRHSIELLVSDLFMCVTGIIKHGEKVWALKSGSYESLVNSTGRHHYEQQWQQVSVGNEHAPEARNGSTDPQLREPSNGAAHVPEVRSNGGNADLEEASVNNAQIPAEPAVPEGEGTSDGNAGTVYTALRSMLKVHDIFAANNMSSSNDDDEDEVNDPKLVELQLGLMHDDLYTRCLVLRTRTGLVLRCISVVSSSVAFALFLSISGKERRYSKADIAISYSLFVGVFFLELCAMVILMMSPWTWAWLNFHGFNRLARASWLLYSIRLPLATGRRRWPSSMGQCNNMCILAGIELSNSITPKLTAMFGKLLRFFHVGEEKISSWLDKLIHTDYVRVDDSIMEKIVTGINEIHGELTGSRARREWISLSSFLEMIHDVLEAEFGGALLMLHMVTDVYLSTVETRNDQESGLKSVSKKLSNYMMYLMVNQPSMLPMNTCAAASRKKTRATFAEQIDHFIRGRERYDQIRGALLVGPQPTGEEVLQELADMWTRVLLYAAGRSSPELHAAHLATGGELITVAWLLMAHQGIGNSQLDKLSFANPSGGVRTAYAFYFPSSCTEDSSSPEVGDDDDICSDSEENSSSTEGDEDEISSEEENDVSPVEDNSSIEGDISGEDI